MINKIKKKYFPPTHPPTHKTLHFPSFQAVYVDDYVVDDYDDDNVSLRGMVGRTKGGALFQAVSVGGSPHHHIKSLDLTNKRCSGLAGYPFIYP